MPEYRIVDDNLNEITALVLPKYCVQGSTYEGLEIAGVDDHVFSDCVNLQSVEINGSMEIGTGNFKQSKGTFEGCSSLEEIILVGDDTDENISFDFIGAFRNCENLDTFDTTNLNLSSINSGIQLGEEAFYNTGFITFNLPHVHTIGQKALGGCQNLTTITTDAYFFGGQAFYNDSALTTLNLNNADIQEFGTQLFYGCTNLTTINYAGTVEQWKQIYKENGWQEEFQFIPVQWETQDYLVHCSNGNTPLDGSTQSEMNATVMSRLGYTVDEVNCHIYDGNGNIVKNIVIPEYYTYNGVQYRIDKITGKYSTSQGFRGVFFNNKDIETVEIQGKVKVEDYAFADCTNLNTVINSNNIISMGCFAFAGTAITSFDFYGNIVFYSGGWYGLQFRNCRNLQYVSFNEGLTRIGVLDNYGNYRTDALIFTGCTALNYVVLPDSVVSLSNNVFDGCSALNDLTLGKNFANGLTYMGSETVDQTITYLRYNGTVQEFNAKPAQYRYQIYNYLKKQQGNTIECLDGTTNIADNV